jgi:hypothetical protein
MITTSPQSLKSKQSPSEESVLKVHMLDLAGSGQVCETCVVLQDVTGQLADKSAQLQQACQNPLFSPEKPQPGSPSTPRDRGLAPESSSLTLQVNVLLCCPQSPLT